VEGLRAKLDESAANLQTKLAENTTLLTQNEVLEAEVKRWKEKFELAERTRKEVVEKADDEIKGLKESLSDMALTNRRAEERVKKLLKKLEVAEDSVMEEHEADYKKALQQAAFFYNIPGKFDVDKDFHEGQLLPINQISSST